MSSGIRRQGFDKINGASPPLGALGVDVVEEVGSAYPVVHVGYPAPNTANEVAVAGEAHRPGPDHRGGFHRLIMKHG